jgi:hypothetical protein
VLQGKRNVGYFVSLGCEGVLWVERSGIADSGVSSLCVQFHVVLHESMMLPTVKPGLEP